MKKRTGIFVIFILCIMLCTGCQCKHEWLDATCTTAKKCANCGQIEGQPLGHVADDWQVSNDIMHASQIREQKCVNCDIILDTSTQNITTFSQDNLFIFSPQEFLDRFEYYMKEDFPDFRYEISSLETASVKDALYIRLFLDSEDIGLYTLSFYDADSQGIRRTNLNTGGVWCVSLGRTEPFKNLTVDSFMSMSYDGNLTRAFYHACDPLWSEETYLLQQVTHLATRQNWLENGEPFGYNEVNNIFYEFGNALFGEENEYFDMQQILAYAAKWK